MKKIEKPSVQQIKKIIKEEYPFLWNKYEKHNWSILDRATKNPILQKDIKFVGLMMCPPIWDWIFRWCYEGRLSKSDGSRILGLSEQAFMRRLNKKRREWFRTEQTAK